MSRGPDERQCLKTYVLTSRNDTQTKCRYQNVVSQSQCEREITRHDHRRGQSDRTRTTGMITETPPGVQPPSSQPPGSLRHVSIATKILPWVTVLTCLEPERLHSRVFLRLQFHRHGGAPPGNMRRVSTHSSISVKRGRTRHFTDVIGEETSFCEEVTCCGGGGGRGGEFAYA